MRASHLIVILLLFSGCAERSDLLLPRLGTVGDSPPPGETIEITVHADGTVKAGDREVDGPVLLALLEARTRDHARDDRYSYLPSRLNVLLRADARAVLRDLLPVLDACSDPTVRANRIFYTVVHEEGGEGAFAWFRPHENCLCRGPDCAPLLLNGDFMAIRAGPRAPVGELLQAADYCMRIGMTGIVLVAARGEREESGGVLVGRRPLTSVGAADLLPPFSPRVRGPAGFHRNVRVEAPFDSMEPGVGAPLVEEFFKRRVRRR